MIILGIESSCDETSASLVKNGVEVLTSVTASSLILHKKTGGIVPEVAARRQIESIIPVINEAMEGFSIKDIDAIAVTVGPGLIGSLLVGVHTAKTLSLVWDKPLIPVNHILAHLYGSFLLGEKIEFPAIGLIVSGGHTDIILWEDHGKYTWLGGTRDDSAGEAFDKTARLLKISEYPGGPAIEELAKKGNGQAIAFPRPMLKDDNYDFSFSGLKTSVLYYVKNNPDYILEDVCASFQQAVVEVLVAKTARASKTYSAKSIVLGGGVTANEKLREMFGNYEGITCKVFVPPLEYCLDSATFIASCAHFNYQPVSRNLVFANPSLHVR